VIGQVKSSELATAASTVSGGSLSNGGDVSMNHAPAAVKPRTAAEYAGTVNGFVNLTTSFDSGIDVLGSTSYVV